MVLPIGFFAPLPLPMMIPFMGIQSAVMAEQFGTLFQYGKRRISAMSNEEFNKLTWADLQDKMNKQITELTKVGGTMEQQIQAMRPMTEIIIKEFLAYLTAAGEAINPFSEGGPLQPPKVGELNPEGEVIFQPEIVPKSVSVDTVGDPYKENVYRNIWHRIPHGIGATASEAMKIVTKTFYLSFDVEKVKTLVVVSVTYIVGSQKQIDDSTGSYFYNEYRIVYHL